MSLCSEFTRVPFGAPPELSVGTAVERLADAIQQASRGAAFALGITPETLMVEGAEANRDGPIDEKGTYNFQRQLVEDHLAVYDSKPFVNGALVRQGFATILTIPPNVRHAGALRSMERRASRQRRGLWGACAR